MRMRGLHIMARVPNVGKRAPKAVTQSSGSFPPESAARHRRLPKVPMSFRRDSPQAQDSIESSPGQQAAFSSSEEPMQRNRITISVIVASWLLTTACERVVKAHSEETNPVPIQVRAPASVERAESVTASGSVEGSETADVAFEVSGKIARVLIEEGQHVTKGQLLAEIEPTDYRNAFNAATAQRQAADAVARKASAGLRKQEVEEARIEPSLAGKTSTSACASS